MGKFWGMMHVSGIYKPTYLKSILLILSVFYLSACSEKKSSIAMTPTSTSSSPSKSIPDTSPPTISIVTPTSNASVSGVYNLTVTASDNIAVTKVEYYLDSNINPFAISYSTPFSSTLDCTNNSLGSHSITAKAYDAAGLSASSTSVSFTIITPPDTTAPTVVLSSPVSGQTITGTVAIAATANDNVAIQKVEFYDGTTLLGTDTTSPYSFNWTPIFSANGLHTITAKAFDTSNLTTTSAGLSVTVAIPDTSPPTSVTITTPSSGTTITSSTTISATAIDNVAIQKIEFYLDNLTSTPLCIDTTSPYTCSWTPASSQNGSHNLYIKAYDTSNNSTSTTTPVTVTVNVSVPDTSPPTVTILTPTNSAFLTGTVSLTSNATDNAGVQKVEYYYDNTNLIGSSTTSPYSVSWPVTALASGSTHSLTAKVYDTSNNTNTTTIAVSIDTTAPTISVATTVNSLSITTPTTTLTATVADPGTGASGIKQVSFYNGSTLLATKTVAPWTYSWTPTTSGTYSISAIAIDNALNQTTSSSITVNADLIAPTVTIAASASTITYPATLTLTSTASDTNGIAKVEFYDSTTLINTDTTSPYSYAFSPTAGTHIYSAKAYDSFGNITTSTTTSVLVNPPAGSISIVTPLNNQAITGTGVTATVSVTGLSTISTVTYYLDSTTGTSIATSNTGPSYSLPFFPTPSQSGAHTLYAVAKDAAGTILATSVGVPITISVGGIKVSLIAGSGLTSSLSYTFTGPKVPSGGSYTYTPAGAIISSAGSNITASIDSYPCAQFTVSYLTDPTGTAASLPPQTIYVYFTGTTVPTIYWDDKCSITQTTTHGGTTNWVPIYNDASYQQTAKNFFIKLLPNTQINLTGKIEGQNNAQSFNLTTSTAIPGTYPAKIVSGQYHNCALISDGTLKCWGRNNVGQLGDGTFIDKSKPTTVLGITTAKDVAVMDNTTCVLLSDKSVKCWGDYTHGKLGIGTTTANVNNPSTAAITIASSANMSSLFGGHSHMCALNSANGDVRCWGYNLKNQVNATTTADQWSPVSIYAATMALGTLASGVLTTSLALGQDHSCAIMNTGVVYCWGANDKGQLGIGTASNSLYPTAQVTNITSGATSIAAYYDHTCAVVSGTLKCWGRNDFAQIGNATVSTTCTGSTTFTSCEPTPITGPSAVITAGVTNVVTGAYHSCVSRIGNGFYCWGNSSNGRLGLTSPGSPQLSPSSVTSGVSTFTLNSLPAIVAGESHTCAYFGPQAGTSCWGLNTYGQVGNNSTSAAGVLTPVHILEL